MPEDRLHHFLPETQRLKRPEMGVGGELVTHPLCLCPALHQYPPTLTQHSHNARTLTSHTTLTQRTHTHTHLSHNTHTTHTHTHTSHTTLKQRTHTHLSHNTHTTHTSLTQHSHNAHTHTPLTHHSHNAHTHLSHNNSQTTPFSVAKKIEAKRRETKNCFFSFAKRSEKEAKRFC